MAILKGVLQGDWIITRLVSLLSELSEIAQKLTFADADGELVRDVSHTHTRASKLSR